MSERQATAEGSWTALWSRPQYRSFTVTVALLRVVAMMFPTLGVLLVLDRTGNAVLAGLVSATTSIPGAIAGPVLGAWLDVAQRRRVLIVLDQLLSAVGVILLVVLAGHAPDWTLPVVGVLLGITAPFSNGSFVSALSELAGPELLDRASAIEATSLNLSLVIGPAIAAVLAGTLGPARVLELEAALTLLAAAAMALNPAFEIRPTERPDSARHALREGTRALVRTPRLRDLAIAGWLTNFGYGTLIVAFPLFAAGALGGHRNDGGYLWAALAVGSILGTFLIPGRPSLGRLAGFYVLLGLSGLLWNVAGSVPVGAALILFSGVLDGPVYSGQMALRQRYAPAMARTQVLNTIGSLMQMSISIGAIVGGLSHHAATAFAVFCAAQLLAGAIAGRHGLRPGRSADG